MSALLPARAPCTKRFPLVALALTSLAACAGSPPATATAPVSSSSASASSSAAPPAEEKAKQDASLGWPIPAGWKSEIIPFPLDFAPSIPYHGREILRFAPKFFDAKAPTYFSYAFAWVLEDRPPPALEDRALEKDLVTYFRGLCQAVGGEKFHFDQDHFKAHLEEAQPRRASARSSRGEAALYDPFGDGRSLTLALAVDVFDCPKNGPRVALFTASPAPEGAPIRAELEARAREATCP